MTRWKNSENSQKKVVVCRDRKICFYLTDSSAIPVVSCSSRILQSGL